ncbi:MAG: hypothetical protein R3F59_16950 [Myxococcota bacterium]
MPDWEAWITKQVGTVRLGRRVLVLCRTRATLAMVRRWAARRGGVLGLEAVTPASLAHQVRQDPILGGGRRRRWPEDLVPGHTAIGRRIGARPGLTSGARRWVQHVRGAQRVGVALDVPDWLQELVDLGWGSEDEEDALLALVDAVRARGRNLAAATSWDKVLAVGFDRPFDALAPWEPALVQGLAGRAVIPPTPRIEASEPLDAVFVPDVVAEARLAVSLARDDPEGTMILVSEAATARRVRDALARNGVPCAWRDSDALEVHTLASAVRRCAAWFADAPDPPIQVGDLSFVLGATALQRALHPAAEEARRKLLERVGLDPAARSGRRALVDALEAARLLDAPLSAWLRRMGDLVAELSVKRPASAVAAAAVAVRLALLSACLAAVPVEDPLRTLTGDTLDFDVDDFEDVLATLLGDDVPSDDHSVGRSAGCRRFLVGCRIASRRPGRLRDPVAAPARLASRVARAPGASGCDLGGPVRRRRSWRSTTGRPAVPAPARRPRPRGLTRRAPPDPCSPTPKSPG